MLCRMSSGVPDYSLIIPAYNEAAVLPETLAAAREAMAGVEASIDLRGELIVVDNNSSDDTAAVARAHGARVVFEGHNQISRARNAGGRAAQGGYLVFLDADTLIDADLLGAALQALDHDGSVGGGARVAFDREEVWPARLTLGAWNLYSRVMREAAGCFIFCTAEVFHEVEGFSERLYASEELWFSKAIKRRGKPQGKTMVIIQEHAAITSARKADRPLHTAVTLALMLLFPPAVFFRRLCGFWYRRPAEPQTALNQGRG